MFTSAKYGTIVELSLAITNHTTMKKEPKARLACSPKNLLGKPLYIRLTPEEKLQIERRAAMEERSRASFLRLLVIRALKQYDADAKHCTQTESQPHAVSLEG